VLKPLHSYQRLAFPATTCGISANATSMTRLDQLNPPKGEVTRLVFPEEPGAQWTMPIERCTTDINATEACTFDTGLGRITHLWSAASASRETSGG